MNVDLAAQTLAPIPAPAPIPLYKSFAVFTASYNQQGDLVRGGVNGTVFFVSPTQAITAYHVLQARNFQPLAGFERVRIWLVHENYRAIEIKAENIHLDPGHDITTIQLNATDAVDASYVFRRGVLTAQTNKVEAEGFRANTTGPILARQGSDIVITSIPKLERMHLEGQVVRAASVTIKAIDLDLNGAPCVELSYQPIVGFSGGPVLADGQVVAMNSFAEPSTFKQTWAQLLAPVQQLARN